jgi:hypothetical protein
VGALIPVEGVPLNGGFKLGACVATAPFCIEFDGAGFLQAIAKMQATSNKYTVFIGSKGFQFIGTPYG